MTQLVASLLSYMVSSLPWRSQQDVIILNVMFTTPARFHLSSCIVITQAVPAEVYDFLPVEPIGIGERAPVIKGGLHFSNKIVQEHNHKQQIHLVSHSGANG
jgi:hypothetical protein